MEKDLAFGFLLSDRNRTAERHAVAAVRLADALGQSDNLRNCYYILMELALRRDDAEDFDRCFDRLQSLLPDVPLSRDFFRVFDFSDIINLKEF